jgi:2-dehydropantoate 2-reductase
MSEKKRILLVGSGGVGTIASLNLELSGRAEVTSVLRSDYDKIVKDGFEIESVDYGNFSGWRPSHISKSVASAVEINEGRPFDFIVVCTKVLRDFSKTEEVIAPAVTPKTTAIVLIQNGIDIEKPVAEMFRDSVVIGGVSLIGSANYSGRIVHDSHDRVEFGYYPTPYQTAEEQERRCREFVELYSVRNEKVVYQPDLLYARWRKLVYNSTLNTICALAQVDSARAYLIGLDESVVRPAMAELIHLAETATGKKMPDGIDQAMLECDDGIYYKPSMQVDVEKGNPMELEAILGNPIRIAKSLGVQVPLLSLIYHLLRGVQFRLLEARGAVSVPDKPSRHTTKPIWLSDI